MKNKISNLDEWAKKIATKTSFVLDKKISQKGYYDPKIITNAIYKGSYKSKPAILKIYNDPNLIDEPISLESFNKVNKSQKLRAPELYKYDIMSPYAGWLIMEKLPKNGDFFVSPLKSADKLEFIKIYLEYRKNFPKKPTRQLRLSETLPSDEYHSFRIARWLQLANNKEAERLLNNRRLILLPREFIPRYQAAMKIIRDEFAKRKMVWCHGHFKSMEIYKVFDSNKYYLIDFGHTKMCPEGYELAFIIWSDHIIFGEWRMDFKKWKNGIDEWIELLRTFQDKLSIIRFDDLIRASLLERCLGTILADITAAEWPYKEKIIRINLIYKLIDSFL